MITIDSISAKLFNEGVNKDTYTLELAKEKLARCVAPVACIKFLERNEVEIIAALRVELFTIVITRNREELKRITGQTSDAAGFREMHRLSSSSADWAITYEGYKVEVINERTEESYFWQTVAQSRMGSKK